MSVPADSISSIRRARRTEFLAECALPKDNVQTMAQIILSVIKYPEGMETIDHEIARELVAKGYHRRPPRHEV